MFDHDPAAQGPPPPGCRQSGSKRSRGKRQMTTSWRYSTARLLIAMVVAATIFAQFSGASRVRAASDDSNRYYERAQGYLAKGELQSAIIELKNAVQADPSNGPARYALGVALLRIGDAAAAEKELTAARGHGVAESQLVDPLARSYLVRGEYQALLDALVAWGQA